MDHWRILWGTEGEGYAVPAFRTKGASILCPMASSCTLTSTPTISLQSKAIQSRETVILPRKLDWMVLDRAEDLKSMMVDNATFIQFPSIGSSTSLITVYGDHLVSVQRTIRSIMQLVRSFTLPSLMFH